MRALLILFMTAPIAAGGLEFDTAKAGVIYGSYIALVYMMSLPGGWLADRFLGQRRATLYGGVVIMLGHISLAIPSIATFYLGLGLVIIGTGLLKANVATMVGQIYAPEDERRDAGFSIFYMGINLGALIAPLVCGWLAQSEQFKGILMAAGISPELSWHFGFGMAAVGMFFGIVQYLGGWKHLGNAGMDPVLPESDAARVRQRRQLQLGIVAVIAIVGLLVALSRSGIIHISAQGLRNAFGVLLLADHRRVLLLAVRVGKWTPTERKRLVVVLVLFLAATVFWSVFEQQGSSLNLFAQRNTDTHYLGIRSRPSWFQSVESVFLVVLAPVFAWVWIRLGKRDPSSPAKFTIGLFFVAAWASRPVDPAAQFAQAGAQGEPALADGHATSAAPLGELFLSPVGISAMSKFAPARIAGLTMGVWYLALSVGNYLGGRVARLYEAFSLPQLFGAVALFALGAAVVLALLIRPIQRMLAR